MRKSNLLFLFIVTLVMTSCMDTYYMTRKTTFDNAISSVQLQMASHSFKPTGAKTNTRNEKIVIGVSYTSQAGYGTGMVNNYITQDTYDFADSLGNTMSYSVTYSAKQTDDGIPYVGGVELCGCETSSPEDYERFCGDDSVVKQFNELPKDQKVERINVGNTTLAVSGILLSVMIVVAMFTGRL